MWSSAMSWAAWALWASSALAWEWPLLTGRAVSALACGWPRPTLWPMPGVGSMCVSAMISLNSRCSTTRRWPAYAPWASSEGYSW